MVTPVIQFLTASLKEVFDGKAFGVEVVLQNPRLVRVAVVQNGMETATVKVHVWKQNVHNVQSSIMLKLNFLK